MTGLEHLFLGRGFLIHISLSFFLFLSIPVASQKVEVITHQKMSIDGLHFWYNDPNRPVALFNKNITPKGDCITIVNDHIFFVWYKGGMRNRNLMLSRKKIGNIEWKTIEFPDKNTLYTRMYRGVNYFKSPGGNSYRIATVGVSTIDGTIHLVYNNHSDEINYRVSKKNIAFASDANFKLSNFSNKKNYLRPGEVISNFTYPNFNTNKKGELLLDYRVGGSKKGDVMMAHYNGNSWSSIYKVINGRASYPTYNFYGKLKYLYGRLYLGGSIRIDNNPIQFNQGFFFGYGGQLGTHTWKNINNYSSTVPFDTMTVFKIANPLPSNSLGMTLSPSFTVSKSGTVHFTNKISGNRIIHFYKPVGAKKFKKGTNGSIVSFAAGKRVYGIEQVHGEIKISSTSENESNWRTDLIYAASAKFDLFSYEYYKGKLYIIANEKKESDMRPLHYIVIDLGILDKPAKKSVPSSISNAKTKKDALDVENKIQHEKILKTLLYPIPVDDNLVIERLNESPAMLQIFSIEGKKIRSIATDQKNLRINTSDYQSGLYTIKIISKGSVESLSFTKK